MAHVYNQIDEELINQLREERFFWIVHQSLLGIEEELGRPEVEIDKIKSSIAEGIFNQILAESLF